MLNFKMGRASVKFYKAAKRNKSAFKVSKIVKFSICGGDKFKAAVTRLI